ncbi:hypothetical protein ABIF94_005711 [Bradyrhizobium ottawaense]
MDANNGRIDHLHGSIMGISQYAHEELFGLDALVARTALPISRFSYKYWFV